MREIEIKARLANKSDLLRILKEKGIALTSPVSQHDRVWGPQGVDGSDGANNVPWLRIRTETSKSGTRYIVTLKKSVTNQLDSIEHETEIADSAEMAKIIEHLGFEPYSDATKTRQKAKLGDLELCVDSVVGLGDFIEVEKLTGEDADYEAVIAELWELLASFDVDRSSEVTEGYDVMMKRKQELGA